jgi:hypothetical protein
MRAERLPRDLKENIMDSIMDKTAKDQVRDILRAQGITTEPTPEAVKVFFELRDAAYSEGSRDAAYDAQMALN